MFYSLVIVLLLKISLVLTQDGVIIQAPGLVKKDPVCRLDAAVKGTIFQPCRQDEECCSGTLCCRTSSENCCGSRCCQRPMSGLSWYYWVLAVFFGLSCVASIYFCCRWQKHRGNLVSRVTTTWSQQGQLQQPQNAPMCPELLSYSQALPPPNYFVAMLAPRELPPGSNPVLLATRPGRPPGGPTNLPPPPVSQAQTISPPPPYMEAEANGISSENPLLPPTHPRIHSRSLSSAPQMTTTSPFTPADVSPRRPLRLPPIPEVENSRT